MHELSIALSLIDAATDEADRLGAASVKSVHLKLGPLSGVVKEALLSAFELAREGSFLGDADLQIEDVPITIRCPRCEAERHVRSPVEMCCEECGTFTADIVHGRELEIVAMEIEE